MEGFDIFCRFCGSPGLRWFDWFHKDDFCPKCGYEFYDKTNVLFLELPDECPECHARTAIWWWKHENDFVRKLMTTTPAYMFIKVELPTGTEKALAPAQ